MVRPFREGESCVECGTTERNFHARGLCVNCYARLLRRENPEKYREIHRKHNQSEKKKNWLQEYYKTDKYNDMMKKSSKKYREANHDLVLERTHIWKENNKDKIKKYYSQEEVKLQRKKNHLRRKFGENAVIVYERDKELCRKCGGDNKVAIHHIDWNDENDSLDNLVCLCSNCHTTVHRWIPPRLRRELFDEWMKSQ